MEKANVLIYSSLIGLGTKTTFWYRNQNKMGSQIARMFCIKL